MCKRVLTAAVTIAKQRQQQRQQGQITTRDATKAVRERQQIEQQVVEADTPAKSASRQLREAADTALVENAGDQTLHKKRVKSTRSSHKEINFVDVEIAAKIFKLENELNEFYDMESEHQKKLSEIYVISMHNDITICNCKDLGNFNETTTTMLPEPPSARTDTHCSTVSKVRGCMASVGDRKVLKREQRSN